MKKIVIKFMIVILVLFMVGCTNNDSLNNNEDLSASSQNEAGKTKVLITAHYQEPLSMKDNDTIILNGISEGVFIEIVVQGEIKEFEHIRLEWDGDTNDLAEKEIINRINVLKNETTVIQAYLPDGIPLEKIKWKSSSEKVYELILADYSLDGETENAWEFDLE